MRQSCSIWRSRCCASAPMKWCWPIPSGQPTPRRCASSAAGPPRLFGAERIGCHFHDTRGMGLANVAAALEQGIRKFDTSVGGLGGCPFAPGATGNVATEDVVLMLQQMGLATGIDLRKLVAAVDLAQELTGHCEGGNSIRWLRGQIKNGALNSDVGSVL